MVSHSSFLYYLVHLFGYDCSDTVRKELQTGFRNCEMRSFIICDRRATAPPSGPNADFRGGLFFKGQAEIEKAEKSQSTDKDKSKDKDKDTSAGKKKMACSSFQDQLDAEAWFEVPHPDDLPTAPQVPRPRRKKSGKPSRKSPRASDFDNSDSSISGSS